jgi:SAM-dependent methyltransferase
VKRVVIPELLDGDAGTPAEIQASLRDLRFINRWFGGAATTRDLIRRVARQSGRSELSLLDVGAGPGDLAQDVAAQLRREGTLLRFTLIDRALSHLVFDGIPSRGIVADALALPFRDGTYDLVSCSLFTHHLEPEQLVRFVNDALRVCRLAVLINDLRREALHLALVYAGMPLYRSRLTRHDGPASVRRAYTPGEMQEMLRSSRAARLELTRHYLCRMGVIAWKQ